jgi:hypothetical protein
VLVQPFGGLLGVANIKGVVGAAQNVDDVVHETTMASSGRKMKDIRLGLP